MRVGFIGLGNMGGPMAKHILDAGHTLTVYDVRKEKNVQVLDAPVSGGPMGAQQATLAVMVGGDRAVYERVKPVLDAIGNKVSYIGTIGCGAIAKLVHNRIAICT